MTKVAVLLLLISHAFSQSEQGTAEQELIRLKQEWGQAYVRHDRNVLERIIAQEYTIVDEDGKTATRQEVISSFLSGSRYTSVEYEASMVRIYDNVAILSGGGITRGQGKSGPFHRQYFSTNLFVKRDGRWQAVATHISGVRALADKSNNDGPSQESRSLRSASPSCRSGSSGRDDNYEEECFPRLKFAAVLL
jgi:hypothetical protein